jgi:very-short-patch-repair endonuclease
MLIVETDDVATHHTQNAFAADRRRDVELTLAGYQVLRFTWADVVERPEWVAYAVSSAASSRKTST